MFSESPEVETQKINIDAPVELFMRREDRIHPFVSGNKYRKLKYNLIEAKATNYKSLLTFGGAYSNHIAAAAYAGKMHDFNTIGVIRGEELKDKITENPTLKFAQQCGMRLHFISREQYREKESPEFLNGLKDTFGDLYVVPEGGTNTLAIKGCEEILREEDQQYDYICCSVGTGGTVSGLINSSKPCQKVFGFSALKGDFLTSEIRKFAKQDHWALNTDYHFGGYGKINAELITFINDFRKTHKIPLDPIYTGKMMFGVLDMVKLDKFPEGSRILAIHTGGLQGVNGMNIMLKKKGLPLIEVDEI
ncbi:MAG: pyridoxal-phosphate dependent enzyme [Bacteroidota bacterium]